MRFNQFVSRIGLFVIGASTLLVAACGNHGGGFPAGGPVEVTVITLKAQPVTLTRELPGRTSAYQISEVRPQVSGIVKQRLFTEGSIVKAGQPLYALDDAIYQSQHQSAEAALQKAKAALLEAQLNANRIAELVKAGVVSLQQNDAAVSALAQAKADVATAEAAVTSSNINLLYARIAAPISGHISGSTVTQGALVTANQTNALATVTQLDPIYVDVNQSSTEWLQLKQEIEAGRVQSKNAGAPVKILLEDGSVYDREAKLQFTEVTVDATTGSLKLRAIAPNPDGLLIPGMYVRAVINEGVLPSGVLAPQQGVTRDPKGNGSALVVDKDDKVEARSVSISRAIGDQWLIKSGLAAGDRLIVEGLQKVRPGAAVHATEAGTAQPDAGNSSGH